MSRRNVIPLPVLLCVTVALWFNGSSLALEITREKADELIAQLPADDPWEKLRDASALAWNEAYVIHAFVDLYEATGDAKYLHEVVRRGDRMLSHRDDRRGFADASGKVHKRWSIDSKYTIGEAVLLDADGRPSIKLRSTLFAYNNLTRVEVLPSSAGGDRFTLHLTNSFWKRDETFSDLSVSPGDPRYFETIINDPKPRGRPVCQPGTCTEASQLLRASPAATDGQDRKPPVPAKLSLTPLWHAHVGYVGIIYHPLLRFAVLVKRDGEKLAPFADAADRFTRAADESFDDIQPHWRDGSDDAEGYYVNCLRGGAEAYDNVGHAFNYLGKLASSQLALWELTENPQHREQAARMATLFKRRLRSGAGDTYVWNYWYEPITTGWTAADDVSLNTPHHDPWVQVEDTSHGALEVEMAVLASSAGVVFDADDVRRFANTYLRNVVLPDRSGFFGRVDGSEPQSRYKGTRVVGWLSLTTADAEVWRVSREVYEKRGQDDFRTVAALLRWKAVIDANGR